MTSDASSLKTHLALTQRCLDESRRTQDALADVAQRNRMALERLALELADTDACPHDRPQCSRAGGCADCWISYALDGARAVQDAERREREHREARKQEQAKLRTAKAGDAGERRRPKPDAPTKAQRQTAEPDLEHYTIGPD